MNFGHLGFVTMAYVIGSVPTGYWLGKLWKGVDIRQFGSGNLGAANVFRVLGPAPGLLTFLIDLAKGWISVFLAMRFFPGELPIAIVTGVAAILGHTMSVFVHFRGGKGVATSAGVFLALLPIPSAAGLAVFALVFGATHYVSLGSLLGAFTLVGASFALSSPKPLSWTAAVAALFVTWTHRANIRRLLEGTENRIAWSKKSS